MHRSPKAVIFQTDLLAAYSLQNHVLAVHPAADCIIATSFEQAAAVLAPGQADLFLTALDVPDGDVLDLLLRLRQQPPAPRRLAVLVSAPRCAPRIVLSLRALSVQGVFDSLREVAVQIQAAIGLVTSGGTYWSTAFTGMLRDEKLRRLLCQLTAVEQLALAIFGDGCSDSEAAVLLGMTHSSVRKLRQRLYGKVGVHKKEEIVREATVLGYTHFTPEGIKGFGRGVLVREYLQYSQRRTQLSPRLLATAGLPAAPATRQVVYPKRPEKAPQQLALI